MNYEKTSNIPVIESDIFDDNREARFAIGIVAVNNQIINGYEREFAGAAKLRANVYLDKGFINLDDLDENGTELNHDDGRSVHFVVVEKLAAVSLARVVGNMRLIIKNDGMPLPVENFYPEAFESQPLPHNSVEVSRLISRHENTRMQNAIKWPLFIAGSKYADEYKLGPAYGLLEPALTRSLLQQEVPVASLAGEKYIEEIHVAKQPIQIDIPQLKNHIQKTGDHGINVHDANFSYLNIGKNLMTEEPKTIGVPYNEVA